MSPYTANVLIVNFTCVLCEIGISSDRILCFLHLFTVNFTQMKNFTLRKVVSSNMSRLEAHAGFFRLLMKRIFDPNAL